MSSFASLMALSATYTKASQSQADAKLAERNRKEAEAKKRKLEQEKQEREREAQLRLKHFEEQKKEEERKRRKEEERKAIEASVERRKAAEREALLHGPAKKSSSHRASASTSQARRRPLTDHTDDDVDDGLKSEPLTREELRERKLQAELRRQFTSAKRSTITGGYQKHGRHLPGGAVDVTTTKPPTPTSSSGSVKARLAAIPNTLTKLNTVKRDTRTIDEILQDRAKAKEHKTLDGQEALAFDDWFGTKKKAKSRPSSLGPASGEDTPKSNVSVSRQAGTPPVVSAKKSLTPKPAPSSRPASKPVASKLNPRSSDKAEKSSLKFLKPNGVSSRPSTSAPKKRTRSPSPSDYSRQKRRAISPDDSDEELNEERLDVSGLIWGIMGKNRDHYMKMDVFSDDEDMEADASALEREEKRSSRIARQEELAALEEEKRHEEEKRRRKIRA
ncbi:hypothetical protein C8R42DRAFT_687241 [Lentinula raphanica]|nr:hypothetical protein C8R42DRAFT_687241 [Lentinula raphanica]